MHKIWVVGFGGIAEAIAQQCINRKFQLTLFSRKSIKDIANSFNKNEFQKAIDSNLLTIVTLDDYTEKSIQTNSFLSNLNRAENIPDIVIITNGLLYDSSLGFTPEKTINDLDLDWLDTSIKANVYTSIVFIKYLNKILSKSNRTKVICLSARVGSISDNRLGGWYSYRMSKVMLNMLVKNTALEWRFKFPHSIIIAYQPGTVDTKLSSPFSKNHSCVFQPNQAAEYLLEVINNLQVKDSGEFIDWNYNIIQP